MNERRAPVRLTSLAHGGGCGCKIAPGVLEEILKSSPIRVSSPDLLVGSDNNEDAAVFRINEHQAVVATTDFFMPIVDDPYEFGRIAATNAISDIYAMGAKPIFALALLGMPVNVVSKEVIRQITYGGESVCARAGIPIAGGHSIDTVEPIYGLVVIGLVDPARFKRNNGARAGDSIILGKPLGVGILSAALKQERLPESGYRKMIECTTQLNTPGVDLAEMAGVHALTDVTGFGLVGHLLELCRGASLNAQLKWGDVPVIPEAVRLAKAGVVTGASGRNWGAYSGDVRIGAGFEEWQKMLLTDPQTSGGLLVSCAQEAEADVLALFKRDGFTDARRIGLMVTGAAGISVT